MTGGEAREAPRYGIEGDYLVQEVNVCTCGNPTGGPPGHEPGCGAEPVMTVAELHERLTSAAPSRAALETLAADFEAAANKRRCTVEHFGDRHERPVVAFTEGEAGAWAEAAEQLRALLADETGDQR